MPLTFAQIEKPQLGILSFAAGDDGLCRVAFCSLNLLKQEKKFADEKPSLRGFQILTQLFAEIDAYLQGLRHGFSVAIDWMDVSHFQQQVLLQTMNIPFGQVSTYAEIAGSLHKPGAARAVGTALAKNPLPIVIPCHRVVGSNMGLCGYLGGTNIKATLLTIEGHQVKNGYLVS